MAGRLSDRALPYRWQAAQNAIRRGAYAGAIDHLTRGLKGLARWLNTSERVQQELTLQMALGPTLSVMRGFGSLAVIRVYARAYELCRQVGEIPQHSAVLGGLSSYYRNRAEFQTVGDLEAQWLGLAQRHGDTADLMRVRQAMGATCLWRGQLTLARLHLKQALALYDPGQHWGLAFQHGFDPWRGGCSLLAQTLWLLGYPAQALASMQRALNPTQGTDHLWTLAFALTLAARLHHCRREGPMAQAYSEAILDLATAHGWPQLDGIGTLLQGWALAVQGQEREGLARLRRGLNTWRATGAALFQPYWLALLAEVAGDSGHAEEAQQALADALIIAHSTGERWWEAELYRCQGELLLHRQKASVEAESCFQQALAMARRQEAKALELRAAMSLSRLWQRQGKWAEVHALLAPIYGWFTEGFDTADLQEARTLLVGSKKRGQTRVFGGHRRAAGR